MSPPLVRRALASLLGAAVAACDASPSGETGTAAPAIEGTWRAAEFSEFRRRDSSRVYPLGQPPHGYLVYDATGHVFFQLQGRGTTDSLRDAGHAAPDSALGRVLRGSLAFFGTYVVDRTHRLVTHHIEGEIPPGAGAFEVATPWRLAGDSLVLGTDSVRRWVFVRVR